MHTPQSAKSANDRHKEVMNNAPNASRVEVLAIEQRARPEHPGAVLREIVLPEVGLTQSELAERLGVSRRTINMILNEQRPVTVDMAHRLSRVFGVSAKFWMNIQQELDIWDALHEHEGEYARLTRIMSKPHTA
jgi:addiction module HigA family antidote